MQNRLERLVDSFRERRAFRIRLICIITALSVVVAIGVAWKLKFTGITMTGTPSCGLEEHVHTDGCTDPDTGALICSQTEHTHGISCYSNPELDVETPLQWESTLPELTGSLGKNIADIALSQLGYKESELNYQVGDNGTDKQGYTRYGAWYGNVYGEWNAVFAAFCLHYAGLTRDIFPYSSGSYSWVTELTAAGLFRDFSEHTPAVGDLVFLDVSGSGRADTVGVIVEATDVSIRVVLGDSNNSVEETIYPVSSVSIFGYGAVPSELRGGDSAEPQTSDDTESTLPADQQTQAEQPTQTEQSTQTEQPTQTEPSVTAEATTVLRGQQDIQTPDATPIIEETAAGSTNRDGVPADSIDLAPMLSNAQLFVDGVPVDVWTGSGAENINIEQECSLDLSFEIGNAVKIGDYYKYAYQMPSSIMSLIDIDTHSNMPFYGVVGGDDSGTGGVSVYMGQYTIDSDGLITMLLDETFASGYVDISIDDFRVGFSWKEDTGTNPVQLTFNEDYVFLLNIIRNSRLLTQKTVTKSSTNPLLATFNVEIKAFGDTTSVSASDTLSGTYSYTDSSGVTHTIPVLEYHAGETVRFRVRANDGSYRDLTGRTDLDPDDSTTAVYTITESDAAAGALDNLPSFTMLDGDTLEFSYPAHVREQTAAIADIKVQTVTGNNEVRGMVDGTDDEFPASASFSYAGKKTQLLKKSATMSQDNSSITWSVNVNTPCLYNVNGLIVYDYIGSHQSYDTASPFIVKTYSRSDTLLGTQYVTWADILSADGQSWHYVISDTDAHKYTIEYTTLVSDSYTGAEALTNGANGRFLDCWYYTPSSSGTVPGGSGVVAEVGQRDYEYTKTGESPNQGEQFINWEATFQVNPGSVAPQCFVFYDTLPTYTTESGTLDVVQLVDNSGSVVSLVDGSIHDITDICELTAYELIDGNLVYDSNGNITNTEIIIPGLNDGVTPIKVGINEVKGPFVNGKPAGFRITKTGRKPVTPQTDETLRAAGFDLPGTFGDYANGYALVLKYRTTSDINTAPQGTQLRNEIKYYFGVMKNRQNVAAVASVTLPSAVTVESVTVEKNGVWSSSEDKIHYTVKINEGMVATMDAGTMQWVDVYDEKLEPTDYITLFFGVEFAAAFPSQSSVTRVIKGGAVRNSYQIPISGFVETSPGSGIFEYIFERKTHCGAVSDPSKWVRVEITLNKNEHTFTYNFNDIPTDNISGRQQNWKVDYFMQINDPDSTFYGPQVLENTFSVHGDEATAAVGTGSSTTSIERKMVDKSCVPNENLLNFTVEVDYNTALEDFTQIEFTDVMNDYLELIFSSIEVRYKLKNGTTAPIQNIGASVVKNFTSGTGILGVTVNAGEPGTAFSEAFAGMDVDKLLLTYNCMVVGALIGESVEISNSVSVDGLSYSSDEYHQIIQVPYIDCIGSGTPLLFSVLKVDGNAIVGADEEPLPGSVFSLYDITNRDTPVLITTRTSGNNGVCSFASADIVTEPAGKSLHTLTPYQLVETIAPSGYVRTSAPKNFFIYSNSDLTDGALVLTPAQQALLEGCTAYYISSSAAIDFTFTNVRTASFSVVKTALETGDVITDFAAQFTLYSDSDCTNELQTVSTVDGQATFVQLQGGTYYFKETAAPEGYVLHNGVYTVTVSEPDISGNVQITVTGVDADGVTVNESLTSDGSVSFPNRRGFILPETGGIGLTAVYLLGGTLTLLALLALFILRRRQIRFSTND